LTEKFAKRYFYDYSNIDDISFANFNMKSHVFSKRDQSDWARLRIRLHMLFRFYHGEYTKVDVIEKVDAKCLMFFKDLFDRTNPKHPRFNLKRIELENLEAEKRRPKTDFKQLRRRIDGYER
jgi:hypothetical protein